MEYTKDAELYISKDNWREICFELTLMVDSSGHSAGFTDFMRDEEATDFPYWLYVLTDIKRPTVVDYEELESALTGGSHCLELRTVNLEIEHRLQWLFEQVLYPDYLRWRGFDIDEELAEDRAEACSEMMEWGECGGCQDGSGCSNDFMAEHLYEWHFSDDLRNMIEILWRPVSDWDTGE